MNIRTTVLCSALLTPMLLAQESKPASSPVVKALETKNKLNQLKLQAELAELTAKVTKLKLERELLSEQSQVDELRRAKKQKEKSLQFKLLQQQLQQRADIAKSEASLANSKLKKLEAQWGQKSVELNAQIEQFQIELKRKQIAVGQPKRLLQPLLKDGTLVISDRRITLNGAITGDTADYITSRIHFYNNRDSKLPIFIVIDASPGGSVMAGYRILKAMEGSDAPIHVVVKSFAASMAATITTLAEHSYAYPNAIILHHQISSTVFGSFTLTEQKEFYQDSQKWWDRLATPIAKKMGITTEEFIKKMYAKSSTGDWTEFATEAQKLKWVNTIVQRIKETSQLAHPKLAEAQQEKKKEDTWKVDDKGRRYQLLPRLNPKDVYFLYNPDSYYRMK